MPKPNPLPVFSQQNPPRPGDDIDGCSYVYAEATSDREIFDFLDEHNDCSDAGGHVYLIQNGTCQCVHCPDRGFPWKRDDLG